MKRKTECAIMINVVLLLTLATPSVLAVRWEDVRVFDDLYSPYDMINNDQSIYDPSSVEQCAVRCSQTKYCQSFFTHLTKQICVLVSRVYTKTDPYMISFYGLKTFQGMRYHKLLNQGGGGSQGGRDSQDCPVNQGFHSFRNENLCLFVQQGVYTYNSSKVLCRSKGGRLPVLDTPRKNEVLTMFLRKNCTGVLAKGDHYFTYLFFLGARSNGDGFIWSTGERVDTIRGGKFRNWSFWVPERGLEAPCFTFATYKNTIGWVDLYGSYKLPLVVCEIVGGNEDSGDNQNGGHNQDCPISQGFRSLRKENLCLFVQQGVYTYNASKTLCRSKGGRLPVLETRRKNEVVAEFLTNNSKGVLSQSDQYLTFLFFLGAQSDGDGFVWSAGGRVNTTSGSALNFWSHWTPQRGQEAPCLSMASVMNAMEWMDVQCGYRLPLVVCERVVGGSAANDPSVSLQGGASSVVPYSSSSSVSVFSFLMLCFGGSLV